MLNEASPVMQRLVRVVRRMYYLQHSDDTAVHSEVKCAAVHRRSGMSAVHHWQ